MAFAVSLWVAVIGLGVMVASSLMIYRYLRALGSEQVRAIQQSGPFSIASMLMRLTGRFRDRPSPPTEN